MAIKMQGDPTIRLGDFILISENPDTYLEVTGGSAETGWVGNETKDPSGWIGNEKLYRPRSVIEAEKEAAEKASQESVE